MDVYTTHTYINPLRSTFQLSRAASKKPSIAVNPSPPVNDSLKRQ